MRVLLSTSAAVLITLGPSIVSAARPGASATKPTSRPTPKSSRGARPKANEAPTPAKAHASRRATVPRATARAEATRRQKNADGSAALATVLRQYVEGSDERRLDREVAAGMKARGASKAAARRILSRIDAAPPGLRKKTFGNASVRTPATKRSLEGFVRAIAVHNPTSTAMILRPAITLPPQGVSKPSSFSLVKTGLVTLTPEDTDGEDELVMLAIVARMNGSDFVLETRDLGSESGVTKGVNASSSVVYSGPETDALIVTAVIEQDNGNGAAAREEVELLVSLAASVAATMPGDDRLAVLKAMVDYTIALDGVGRAPDRAARSVVATPYLKSDWFPLWSVDASTTAPADWKLAIPHAAGRGRYELLLDVPGTTPEMTTVRATVRDFELDIEIPYHLQLDWTRVTVAIGDQSTSFTVEGDAPLRLQPVERMVATGDVDIAVRGKVELKYPATNEYKRCARKAQSRQRARCRKKVRETQAEQRQGHAIDFAAGPATEFRSAFSTVLNGFKKAVNTKKPSSPGSTAPTTPPSVLRKKTAQGSDKPSGKAVVSARVR